jgi:hypothetical protein
MAGEPNGTEGDLDEAARAADAARGHVPTGWLDWSIVGS